MVAPDAIPEAHVVWEADAACVVELRWRPAGGEADREMFQALRIHAGKIHEIADFRQLGAATKMAKRFVTQSLH